MKHILRVVLDTNVVISAFITANGNSARIMRMIFERKFDICYNSIILAEYEGVAARKKFAKNIDQNHVRRFFKIIKTIGVSILPEPSLVPFTDESDRIFYDTAKTGNAVLITGNIKHFPRESFIVLPADFLTMPQDGLFAGGWGDS
jgi:putative PIN family toxin of toxin-antitoxin system